MPGKKREDRDFFAAYLVNHILGGGTFSSRLYSEIREKRGLTYGIGSSIVTQDHTAYIGAGFGTRSDQAADALELTLAEIEKMAKEGPSPEELELAKKYVIGSYAINNLDTSSKIADVLVGLQSSGLGINYIDDRVEYINSVTLEDAKRVAAEMLSGKPTVITIGPGDV
jgi:zinc protease